MIFRRKKSLLFFIISIITLTNCSNLFCFNKECLNIKDTTSIKFFVNKILIFGNDVTKEEVILREMQTKENDTTNLRILEQDIMRLYNLGLFNKIDVLPVSVGDNKLNLMITVTENFYIMPLPQAGIKEGDIGKLWAGMNLMWRNFRGWNETLGLNFGIGYEPFINAYYLNPWIGKSDHFFTTYNLGYSYSNNRNVFTDESAKSVYSKDDLVKYSLSSFNSSFGIGKYFGKYTNVNTSFSYTFLRVSDYAPGRTISLDGKDSYLSFSAGINYDTRDLFNFTTSGTFLDVKYTKYGILHNQIDVHRVCTDMRKFIPLNIVGNYSFTFASRIITSNSLGGNIPVYLRETFGFDKIIRGWKDEVFEGENIIGFFNELRFPVIKPFYVDGKNHILLNNSSLLRNFSYRYGLYLTAFCDVGSAYNRSDNLFNLHFNNGFGFGADLLLPFNLIMRIDYAARKQNTKYLTQFIFSLNSSF
jgi:outer membrane protein assembly factor BamA